MINLFGYRLPGEDKMHAGFSSVLEKGLNDDSFIIAPFIYEESSILSIPFEREISISEIDSLLKEASIEEMGSSQQQSHDFPNKSTDYYFHISYIGKITNAIGSGMLDKCVATRVIVNEGEINVANIFLKLCESYKEAFVFFFHTPLTGTWLGASPELLLSRNGNTIRSMSLAGTRASGNDMPWGDKEKSEQSIVTDFIISVFKNNNIDPETSEVLTRNAGPVEHLMTIISGTATERTKTSKLLSDLSPTPALSGFPRKNAIDIITCQENFERGCYGGFCGWMTSINNFDMFVNLRSMRLERNRYCIFVGGGIMGDSVPHKEWEETEKKAETLINILTK